MELGADATAVRDSPWPMNDHAIPRATKVRRDLLGPPERRVHGPGPDGEVRVGLVAAPDRDVRKLVRHRHLDAIEEARLIWRAIELPFGARTVVTGNEDDQRIVQLTQPFDLADD